MKRSDNLYYHEIQHFEVGELVIVRPTSELEFTDPRGYEYHSFYQPRTGGYSLAFNDEMAMLGRKTMRIRDVEKREYGYVYFLEHVSSRTPTRYTYTAFFLAKHGYPSNQAASTLLEAEF